MEEETKKTRKSGKQITFADGTSYVLQLQRRRRQINRRSIYQKQMNALWELFSDYSQESTVHGVRYMGEKKRHWIERLFWIIAFVVSAGFCGKLIWAVYEKWDQIPVIVSFNEKSTPISQIPFPSVTICPETKANRNMLNYSEMFELTKSPNKNMDVFKHKFRPYKQNMFMAVAQLCHKTPDYHSDIMYGNSVPNMKLMKKLAMNKSTVFHECNWNGRNHSCDELFQEIWTDEGLCFTFNFLNSSYVFKERRIAKDFEMLRNDKNSSWTPKKGYTATGDVVYPRRVYAASDGLSIILRVENKHIDFACDGPVPGYRILLHTPDEIPQISKYFYRVALNREMIMSVRPSIMTTSNILKNYDPKKRQCFFNFEKHLKYFKSYTQRNCQLECIANNTMKHCGCVSFATPRSPGTPVCDLSQTKCYREVESKIKKRYDTKPLCDCLPACNSISYDAELSHAKYHYKEFKATTESKLDDADSNQTQFAKITISFKDNQFFASRRSELYNFTDFLANCGGLLGLCLGVSLLSIVEFIYFTTLRLGCNLRKRRLKMKRQLARKNSPAFEVDESNSQVDESQALSLVENRF